MKSLTIISIFFVATTISRGQVGVTFQLDLDSLIKLELFSSESNDKVFVAGSFNNWEGTNYELKKLPESNIYSGIFKLGNVGDTISYKFVIKKGDYSFWEWKPDPKNQDNGNRKYKLKTEENVIPVTCFSHNEYFSYPVIFSKKKLQEDYLQFRNILETTHPALYDYTEKAVLDSIFDKNFIRIDSDLNFRSFLIQMTEVISKVGCGHSSLWIPDDYWKVAPEKLFPLELCISSNKVFVKGSYDTVQQISVGSEIVSINGTTMPVLVNKLTSLTSADGFNPSYRLSKVSGNFSVKYALYYGYPDSFAIEYIPPESQRKMQANLKPVAKKDIDNAKQSVSKLNFEELEASQTGILTINSFGYYGQVDMFKKFIDSVFLVINQNDIKNLVLDVRGNSGGDPFCASYLWAYLEPEPLPYFEDHYGKYDTLANPVPKPVNHYKGRLFTLIDGNGFSTTGHFCGLLKYHRVGKFIGSEMGSTYTCTGNATYPPLKNTGIMVGTARVRRYTAAVKNMNPRRGIMPDYPIEQSQDDIIENRDAIMNFTLNLIKTTK
ncbi:S41 family peptidase [Saccharicrinis sp. FJH62]|uniref:S41 family peptidase n=1 Tax=Saccharicrinis sp. FJH62 TaxID=3344657 RepID=UPI0035D4BE47